MSTSQHGERQPPREVEDRKLYGEQWIREAHDKLDDALREILDVTTGWTRKLSDVEKLKMIENIGSEAIKHWGAQRLPKEERVS